MPSLKKVPEISTTDSSLLSFVDKVNRDIATLNQLINEYNSAQSDEALKKLEAILHFKQAIENKYSDKHINSCPGFSTEILENLYTALKEEFVKHGVSDLYGIVDPTVFVNGNDFSKILTNMSPAKVNSLIAILSQGASFNIKDIIDLYAPEGNAEFDAFLQNNTLSFLGGGNSRNFKIAPNDGSPAYVLKIENRMGVPKEAVTHLKDNGLSGTLTPVMAERMGSVSVNGTNVTRTILTTEFCSGGDLIAHGKKHENEPEKHAHAAVHVYSQMADILTTVINAGCAFPDMKNSNWLIDENDTVVLADTKSFIFCEKGGLIDYQKTLERTGGSFVQTTNFNPYEVYSDLANNIPISADKLHAFILGKNLYQYLTQCDDHDLNNISHYSALNYDYPVFKTEEGMELKALIEKLILPNPLYRISIAETKERLDYIASQHPHAQDKASPEPQGTVSPEDPDTASLKRANRKLLAQIEACGFGENDIRMKKFIRLKMEAINSSDDPYLMVFLQKELTHTLNQQKPAGEVHSVIDRFRKESGFFTIGMNAKADRIEQAMCNIPVEDRGKILDKNYEQGRQVHMAVASHRHFSSLRTIKTVDNEIDAESASKSYNTFKSSLNAIKADMDEDSAHEERNDLGSP